MGDAAWLPVMHAAETGFAAAEALRATKGASGPCDGEARGLAEASLGLKLALQDITVRGQRRHGSSASGDGPAAQAAKQASAAAKAIAEVACDWIRVLAMPRPTTRDQADGEATIAAKHSEGSERCWRLATAALDATTSASLLHKGAGWIRGACAEAIAYFKFACKSSMPPDLLDVPAVNACAVQAWNALGDAMFAMVVDDEMRRHVVAMTADALGQTFLAGVALMDSAVAVAQLDVVCATLAAAPQDSRCDCFELVLEKFLNRFIPIASPKESAAEVSEQQQRRRKTRSAPSLAVAILRAVMATVWPTGADGARPPLSWMPQAYGVARKCARSTVVMLLRRISDASTGAGRNSDSLNESKALIEQLVGELASESVKADFPAAPTILRAIAGSITAILRSRGSGDTKVLAVRILGQAAARISAACADVHGEALCGACKAAEQVCPACADPAAGAHRAQPAETGGHVIDGEQEGEVQRPQQDPEEATGQRSRSQLRLHIGCRRAPLDDEEPPCHSGCDVCMLRMAAWRMSQRLGAQGCLSADTTWAPRELVLQSFEGHWGPPSHCAGHAALARDLSTADIRPRDPQQSAMFQVCEWAALFSEAAVEGQASPDDEELAGKFLREGVERITLPRRAPGMRESDGSKLYDRLQRPHILGVASAAKAVRQKMLRAILLQARSPRVLLRAAMLRSLSMALDANPHSPALGLGADSASAKDKHQVRIPRPALLSWLTQDPSAHVRQAALVLVGHLLSESSVPSWTFTAVRSALRSDASPAVRGSARRLLAIFIRKHPDHKDTAAVCADFVSQFASLPSGPSRAHVLEELRRYVFGSDVGLRADALLDLVAAGNRVGANNLLRSLLKAHGDAVGCEQNREATRHLAGALLSAMTADPQPSHVAGLLALSEAAPWSLAEHVGTVSAFLAVSCPPSASEELVALGACAVLTHVLGAAGLGAARTLSPWAWARVDLLVKSQSSRLARPAMRCLCAAAASEGSARFILSHLRTAASLLRAEARSARGLPGLTRAAWVAATACECCDVDALMSFQDLQLDPRPGQAQSVGATIAMDLLQVFSSHQAAGRRASLPALVLAVGFALRRYSFLAVTPVATTILEHSLLAKPGGELLAERSLETLTQLLDHMAECSNLDAAPRPGPRTLSAGEISTYLLRHQPAILRLMRHGLFRRAAAADIPLRTRAHTACRALHKAGLGHPGKAASAAFPSLFADRALRRSASLLLCSLASQHPEAVATAAVGGVREAFCAMAWQTPRQLIPLGDIPATGLQRGCAEACHIFKALRRCARGKWVRALVAELQLLQGPELRAKLPQLPTDLSGANAGRLSPFSSNGRKAGRGQLPTDSPGAALSKRLQPFSSSRSGARRAFATPARGRPPAGDDMALFGGAAFAAANDGRPAPKWSSDEWLALLYGCFLARMVSALPLSEAEGAAVVDACNHFLELRAAAAADAASSLGHTADEDASCRDLFPVCVSAALCRSLVHALGQDAGARRSDEFRRALEMQLHAIAVAVNEQRESAGKEGQPLSNWLEAALAEGDIALPRKRRRTCAPSAVIATPSAPAGSEDDLRTPPKRALPVPSIVGSAKQVDEEPLAKKLRH